MDEIILRISWYHRKVEESNLWIPSREIFLKMNLRHVEVLELNGLWQIWGFPEPSPVSLRKTFLLRLNVLEQFNQESFSATKSI